MECVVTIRTPLVIAPLISVESIVIHHISLLDSKTQMFLERKESTFCWVPSVEDGSLLFQDVHPGFLASEP